MKSQLAIYVFAFAGIMFTLSPVLTKAQERNLLQTKEQINATESETLPLTVQIDYVVLLMDQLTAESKRADLCAEDLDRFEQDIETLNELILWMESGNQAAHFYGKVVDHTIYLLSPVLMPDVKTADIQPIFAGEEIMKLPGLSIKRIKK